MRLGARVGLLCLTGALSILLADGASARDRPIDRFGGGGTSRSPDGRWTIWSKPSLRSLDSDAPAKAYVRGPGGTRPLLKYNRVLDIVWAPDRRHVIANLIGIHWQRLEVHDLARATKAPRRIQADIERQMTAIQPSLQRAEWQRFAFGQIDRQVCLAVEQNGTPRGITEGSFIARAASFRIDFHKQKAIRIARCPGAKF